MSEMLKNEPYLALLEQIEALHHLKSLDPIKELLRADQEGRVVILNSPRMPVVTGLSAHNTDVYCPHCKKNLSGIIGDEWIEDQMVLQCPVCGTYLDATQMSERYAEDPAYEEKLAIAKDIGDMEGAFWIDEDSVKYPYWITGRNGLEWGYATIDALLADMLSTLETYVKPTRMQYAIDYIKANVPKTFSPSERIWKRK